MVRLMISVMLCLLASTGCNHANDFERAHRVATFSEAGTVNISILPASDFRKGFRTGAKMSSLADEMKPKFAPTREDALKAAVPTTTYVEEQLLSALIAKVSVAPPTTSITGERKDGVPPDSKITPPSIAEANKRRLHTDRPSEDAAKDKAKAALPIDPLYQYSTAAAVYQHARLIDAMIDGIANASGYAVYMTPVNINVKPYARYQPYDAYLTIGFFVDTFVDTSKGQKPVAAPVVAIPLLVTDNAEGVQTARTVEVLTQFQFALTALLGGFGASADLAKVRQELRSALGTEINSLLTVGRSTDNALSVRIGSQRSSTSGYAMVPRNNTIYALLLVRNEDIDTHSPNSELVIRVVSKATLRDAQTGAILAYDESAKLAAYKALLPRVVPDAECQKQLFPSNGSAASRIEKLEEIRVEIQRQDFEEARRLLRKVCAGRVYETSLWVGLSEISGSTEFQSASLRINVNPMGSGRHPGARPPQSRTDISPRPQ